MLLVSSIVVVVVVIIIIIIIIITSYTERREEEEEEEEDLVDAFLGRRRVSILSRAFFVVMYADVVQILERRLPSFAVRHHRVFQTPFFGKNFESFGNFWLSKLRGIREEVVDDLQVQITHQPVDARVVRANINRVLDGVSDPTRVVPKLDDFGVRVRGGEVREEVHAGDPHGKRVEAVRVSKGNVGRVDELNQRRSDDVRRQHPRRFLEVFLLHHFGWVQHVQPKRHDKHAAGNRDKRPRLESRPESRKPAFSVFFHRCIKKSNRRSGVQIHIVSNLLGRRVVFVVHDVPHVARGTQTESHQTRLDAFIDPNVTS